MRSRATQDGVRQEIIYIWDYYLLGMAQTKVHKYKQGGLILDKREFMVGLLSPSLALSLSLTLKCYVCELVIAWYTGNLMRKCLAKAITSYRLFAFSTDYFSEWVHKIGSLWSGFIIWEWQRALGRKGMMLSYLTISLVLDSSIWVSPSPVHRLRMLVWRENFKKAMNRGGRRK